MSGTVPACVRHPLVAPGGQTGLTESLHASVPNGQNMTRGDGMAVAPWILHASSFTAGQGSGIVRKTAESLTVSRQVTPHGSREKP